MFTLFFKKVYKVKARLEGCDAFFHIHLHSCHKENYFKKLNITILLFMAINSLQVWDKGLIGMCPGKMILYSSGQLS